MDIKKAMQLYELRAYLEEKRAEQAELEERYNPYHDPTNGRFASASGSIMYVAKGNKGNGQLISVDQYGITNGDSLSFEEQVRIKRNYGKTSYLEGIAREEAIDSFSDGELSAYRDYLAARLDMEKQDAEESKRKRSEAQRDVKDWERNSGKLREVSEKASKSGYVEDAVFDTEQEYIANDRKYEKAFSEVFSSEEKARYNELEKKYSTRRGITEAYLSQNSNMPEVHKAAAKMYSLELDRVNAELAKRKS